MQVDLTGFEELTPYQGGWCGNDCAPISLAGSQEQIRSMAQRLGDRLYEEGYRGVFCMDYLIDLDDDTVYLGEINPRISGASPLTNLITSRYGGVPLFLFHLLEFMDVDWECDLERIQSRWRDFDRWSQLVLKQTTDEVEIITEAPASGLWRMNQEGEIHFVRMETDWHNVTGSDEAFYLRVYGVDEYRYPGSRPRGPAPARPHADRRPRAGAQGCAVGAGDHVALQGRAGRCRDRPAGGPAVREVAVVVRPE